ncbi:YihA family ribosome biogenesis GTP-binding protein [bacterium]|nr:YihA family ribosome biogenesis GTP-binding protein [bacterium]
MDVKSTEFIKSAVFPDQYPESDLPEVAFAGRSNVGKSSLINTLVNRKSLVRTSRTPGRTRLINFFAVNSQFVLADLPGYGFASVPLAVKREWGTMIETYLARRKNLRGVVLILDVRRVPSREDLSMHQWLKSYSIPTLLVINKCDKVSRNERARQAAVIARTLEVPGNEFVFFSALSREGKENLLERLETLLFD